MAIGVPPFASDLLRLLCNGEDRRGHCIPRQSTVVEHHLVRVFPRSGAQLSRPFRRPSYRTDPPPWRCWRAAQSTTRTLEFHSLPAPTTAEVSDVALRTAQRLDKLLRAQRRSLSPDECTDPEPLALQLDHPALAACDDAASRGLAVSGDREGQPSLRLMHGQGSNAAPSRQDIPAAEVLGVNLYSKQVVDGRDRRQLERLCRYLLRPPIAAASRYATTAPCSSNLRNLGAMEHGPSCSPRVTCSCGCVPPFRSRTSTKSATSVCLLVPRQAAMKLYQLQSRPRGRSNLRLRRVTSSSFSVRRLTSHVPRNAADGHGSWLTPSARTSSCAKTVAVPCLGFRWQRRPQPLRA